MEHHLNSCATCHRARGVTLVEMAMVVLVMAFLAAIAVPRLGNVMRHQRLDLATRRAVEDIRLAQSHAILDKANRSVVFTKAQQKYALPDETNTNGKPYEVVFNTSPYQNVRLLSVAFGAGTTLAFNRLGVPTSGGTVYFGDGRETVTITVSSTTGRVSRTMQSAGQVTVPAGN